MHPLLSDLSLATAHPGPRDAAASPVPLGSTTGEDAPPLRFEDALAALSIPPAEPQIDLAKTPDAANAVPTDAAAPQEEPGKPAEPSTPQAASTPVPFPADTESSNGAAQHAPLNLRVDPARPLHAPSPDSAPTEAGLSGGEDQQARPDPRADQALSIPVAPAPADTEGNKWAAQRASLNLGVDPTQPLHAAPPARSPAPAKPAPDAARSTAPAAAVQPGSAREASFPLEQNRPVAQNMQAVSANPGVAKEGSTPPAEPQHILAEKREAALPPALPMPSEKPAGNQAPPFPVQGRGTTSVASPPQGAEFARPLGRENSSGAPVKSDPAAPALEARQGQHPHIEGHRHSPTSPERSKAAQPVAPSSVLMQRPKAPDQAPPPREEPAVNGPSTAPRFQPPAIGQALSSQLDPPIMQPPAAGAAPVRQTPPVIAPAPGAAETPGVQVAARAGQTGSDRVQTIAETKANWRDAPMPQTPPAPPPSARSIGPIVAAPGLVQMAPPFTERTRSLRDQSGFAADITGAPRTEIPLVQTLQPVQARPDLTGTTLRQITDVVQNLPQRPVEIQLSPEELGRLRLAITGGEQALMVHVTAERPETMDLLRRHLDALHQEIRDLGFENISFSFAGERGAEQPADAETTQKPQAAAAEENPQVHPQIPPPPDPRAGGYRPGGLDLRV